MTFKNRTQGLYKKILTKHSVQFKLILRNYSIILPTHLRLLHSKGSHVGHVTRLHKKKKNLFIVTTVNA